MKRRDLFRALFAAPLLALLPRVRMIDMANGSSQTAMTLLDVAKRSSDGSMLPVIKTLSQRNQFLEDDLFIERMSEELESSVIYNGHRVTDHLPNITFRKIRSIR